MSLICSTRLLYFLIGKLLFMGSAIINSVLVCSIDTSCLLIISLTLRYFMSIRYFCFYSYHSYRIKTLVKLLKKILIGLTIESTILRSLKKFLNHLCLCNEFIAYNKLWFRGRCRTYLVSNCVVEYFVCCIVRSDCVI